jgi:hypothetical protein
VLVAAGAVLTIDGAAQDRRSNDPRVGLKPGLRNAGTAIRNMELIASLPKPEGFFDPEAPAGVPSAPETPAASGRGRGANPSGDAPTADAAGRGAAPDAAGGGRGRGGAPAYNPATVNRLRFTNSDLAFQNANLFAGNYHGFNVYNIEDGRNPRLLASVVCPGGQGDVSVHRNLLFMSVEEVRGRTDCGIQGVPTAVSNERFRGVRIFDISDLSRPRQVAAVQTCRGSHTHTLVVDPDDTANVYIYGSGTGAVRSAEELAGCSGGTPDQDPNTSLFSIDVIQVPLAAPQASRVVNRPRIFSDPVSGNIAGLWQGGNHGEGTQSSGATRQCHDITVFPEVGLAAGACAGNGILLDISDPASPVRIDQVVDKAFSFWHSATFNNDGTKVIFTDEWGGGTRARCRAVDPPTWGGNAIFDIVDRKLQFRSYYKMPAPQTEQENCVAHNGSIIPVPGRDIMVQGWYQGGLSVFDFTDSSNPVEIAFFDRGPIDGERLITGGYWSVYWYNGNIYGSEIARGLDVFRLRPSEYLSSNEIAAASLVNQTEFNAQQQTRIVWPATTVVARAYLDQLNRDRAIERSRTDAVRSAMDRADRARNERDRAAAADQLYALALQLDTDRVGVAQVDARRLRALADVIRARATSLREM